MKNYLPNILITGSDGQLGNALRTHAGARDFHITACSRDNLDITDPASIDQAIKQYTPDFIVNTAAYTAVDTAEKEIDQAVSVNHLGAQHLAQACAAHKIPLIHISTDYVFDGDKVTPYLEEDAVNPVNLYGKSKYWGEQAVREYCEQHLILRVSGVFSEFGHNFLKTILRLASERKELNIVADQFTCPTYAGNIAAVIYSLIKQPLKSGIYHYCDNPPVSWHEFATAIIQQAKKQRTLLVEKINAITTAEYPTLAKRPVYSVLDCNKIKRDYDITQAEWAKQLDCLVVKNTTRNDNTTIRHKETP